MQINRARKLYILTGAGLSVESGLDTFRCNEGIWSKYDLREVCNYNNWLYNKPAIFEFYSQRKREILKTEPNAAHYLLAQWQAQFGANRVILLTQNIDNLLTKAGAEAVHLHGDIHTVRCTDCEHVWDIGEDDYLMHQSCPICQAPHVKPNVIFFHEPAPNYAHVRDMFCNITEHDLFICIGTSLEVLLPQQIIPDRRFGSKLNWQVNPRIEHADYFGINLAETASCGLPKLTNSIMPLME